MFRNVHALSIFLSADLSYLHKTRWDSVEHESTEAQPH